MKKQAFLLLRGIALVSAFLLLISVTVTAQNSNEAIQFKGGTWQTIVDGFSGEGAFFYRLNFEDDGTVEVIKQFGGSDNLVETKQWYQDEEHIILSSEAGDVLTDFDGPSLQIRSEEALSYAKDGYEGEVRPYKHMLALVHWIMILLVLIMLNELFRRSKLATLMFFGVLTLTLSIFVWPNQGVTYWFKWVKVYSVVFAVLWFTLIRYTKAGQYTWIKLVAALFLAVNIAEAVSQDFSMGFLPNTLNGIAGVLNIITLFYGWKQIAPDTSKHKDMVWPKMAVLWIVAYDVWNIVYVYLNFPGSTSAQLMVLLSCTIPALFIKKGTWLQARGFTLAVWFMYYFTFPRFTEQMELMVPRNTNLMLAAGVLSISLNVLYFGIFISRLRKK